MSSRVVLRGKFIRVYPLHVVYVRPAYCFHRTVDLLSPLPFSIECGTCVVTHSHVPNVLSLCIVASLPRNRCPIPSRLIMSHLCPDPVDLNVLLQAIRDGLLLHPARAGAVRVVIESEAGEALHVVRIDARRSGPVKRASRAHPPPGLLAELIAATSSAVEGEQRDAEDRGLLQQCHEQQQRIAELEQQLRQAQEGLHRQPSHPLLLSPSSPASSTDSDDSHRSSVDEAREGTVLMMDEADDAPPSSSVSPLSPPATVVRKSERSKSNGPLDQSREWWT